MWLKRSAFTQLCEQLSDAEHHVALVDQTSALVRRAHQSELRSLLSRLRSAEKRATAAEEAMQLERHENNRMVRHLTNMLLRARQIGAYPLQPEQPTGGAPTEPAIQAIPDTIDPGELRVHIEEGAKEGIPAREVVELVYRDRGLQVPENFQMPT